MQPHQNAQPAWFSAQGMQPPGMAEMYPPSMYPGMYPPGTALRPSPVIIAFGDPLLHVHGRWDDTNTSWWAGTGFDVVATGLTRITVMLGDLTTDQGAIAGLSINHGPWIPLSLHAGPNPLPLLSMAGPKERTVVRLVSLGWQHNNIQLASVVLNPEARAETYVPQGLKFQFVGDSLSAGQYCRKGVVDAWTFKVAEMFKAEWSIQAQPGGALTDMETWGNVHGLSFQFFQAEDTGYFYSKQHNYTKEWNFSRDEPPTHVFVHIGANDASERYHVPVESFEATYKAFLDRLRTLYPTQPIFICTPWGRFNDSGSVTSYYDNPSPYKAVVAYAKSKGDESVFLVDMQGWAEYSDMFPENRHPSEAGHTRITKRLGEWLRAWGLKEEQAWKTLEGSNVESGEKEGAKEGGAESAS